MTEWKEKSEEKEVSKEIKVRKKGISVMKRSKEKSKRENEIRERESERVRESECVWETQRETEKGGKRNCEGTKQKVL